METHAHVSTKEDITQEQGRQTSAGRAASRQGLHWDTRASEHCTWTSVFIGASKATVLLQFSSSFRRGHLLSHAVTLRRWLVNQISFLTFKLILTAWERYPYDQGKALFQKGVVHWLVEPWWACGESAHSHQMPPVLPDVFLGPSVWKWLKFDA